MTSMNPDDKRSDGDPRRTPLFFVHALVAPALVILPAAFAGNGPFVPIWLVYGGVFFTVFYARGQSRRPLPPADIVTAARFILAGVFVALTAGNRLPAAIPVILLILMEAADGLDGYLARRTGATPFGGIWDMETDAYVILVLAGSAVWVRGMPPWALLPGLARYLFFFPFLILRPEGADFPPALSFYSKTVCVVTVFVLGGVHVLPRTTAVVLSAAVTLAMASSFLWEAGYYLSRRSHTRNR